MAALVAFACASAAVACGPEFPNSYYGMPESALLAAPEGIFAAEIARIATGEVALHRAVQVPGPNARWHTLEVDVGDVQRALIERGIPNAKQLAWDYEAARREFEKWVDRTYAASGERLPPPWPEPPEIRLRPEIPVEFRAYFEGAIAWHRKDVGEARAQWRRVLALPAAERRHRAVWASFMLGRSMVGGVSRWSDRRKETLDETRKWLRETRTLVAEGFPDPLGLAAASFGWEARAALLAGEHATAIKLYLAHHVSGDASAVESLRRTAADAMKRWPKDFPALARDEKARRVITAYLVSLGEPRLGESTPSVALLQEWAAALEQAGIKALPDADRIAWQAYEAGLFALAQQWIALAGEGAEACWLRAKLALHAGNLRDGERWLRAALAGATLADVHRERAAGELSRVCLARDDYAGAIEAALRGGHWEDAAFVAERVMTMAELKAFVDALPPDAFDGRKFGRWFGEAEETAPRSAQSLLSHLLARRLARAGRTPEAENYFPAAWRAAFHGYAADVQTGFDAGQPAETRAAAFWRAAQTIREHGMELLGAELEPDWAVWSGAFQFDPSAEMRRRGPGLEGGLFAPTPAEQARLTEQRAPQKRFHYRYRAAELAWWAASLLPNDSDRTAEILATAGGWLKHRDPEAAKPFYQALVIRCGNTTLGRAAAEKRWFP